MQITDVRVRKITKEGKMKAVVSMTLDDEFVVHDIKIIDGDKGLFIAMPMTPPETGYERQKAKKKPDTATTRKTSFSKKRMQTA